MNAGASFRPARAGDESGIAAVHWAARRLAYRGLLPSENLDGRSIPVLTEEWIRILARQDGSETLVTEYAGTIVGFVTGGPVRELKHPAIGDLSGITAEVSLLYVLPEHMGKRLGRALFGRSAHRLADLGHTGLLIWGHRDNPFLRFYERVGGIAAATSNWEVDGRLYPSTAYLWRDLPALMAACGLPLST